MSPSSKASNALWLVVLVFCLSQAVTVVFTKQLLEDSSTLQDTTALSAIKYPVKAVWWSRYDRWNDIEGQLKLFQSKGINRIYVNVYSGGYIYYKSSTFTALAGSGGPVQDRLTDLLPLAQKYKIEVFAWYEYGNCYGNSKNSDNPSRNFESKVAAKKGWTLNGIFYDKKWMDLSNVEVRNYMAGLIKDLVTGYPSIKGIQLDDHFGMPHTLVSAASKAIKAVDDTINAIRAVKGNALFSLSPHPKAKTDFRVDGVKYLANGLLSELAPQLYQSSSSAFVSLANSWLQSNGATSASLKGKIIAGLRGSGTTTPDTPAGEVDKMVKAVPAGMGGASLWHSKFINDNPNLQLYNVK